MPDYQTNFFNIYQSQKHYLDSASTTVFRCFFVDHVSLPTITCNIRYHNVVDLNGFIVNHYPVLAADPTKTMSANALAVMYQAIVDAPPSFTKGVSHTFHQCNRAFQTDPATGAPALDTQGNPIVNLVRGNEIAHGVINNFGNTVQTHNCISWGSSQNDLIGSINGGTCKEYATQADAIGACEGAMWYSEAN